MAGTEGHGAQSAPSPHPLQKTLGGKLLIWLLASLWSLVLGTGGSLLAAYILSTREKANVAIPAPTTGPILVAITEVPHTLPQGESAPSRWIRGDVREVSDPKEYRVVVYSYTNRWYIQPNEDQPFTGIKLTGQWEAYIQGGSYYAAMLVKGETPLPFQTMSLPTTAPQVITWDVKEGKSNFWKYFFTILPFAIATAALILLIGWVIRRMRAVAVPQKAGAQ